MPLLVFTTSRSGSTWLTELLFGINQCGPLPEHLRPRHFEYAIRCGDDGGVLEGWFRELAALIDSGRDGGSKLIWDYFPDLYPQSDITACRSALEPLLALRPFCLRLRRRDLIAQAVSRYRSSLTGIYHHSRQAGRPLADAMGSVDAEALAQTGNVFDAAAIAHHEDILRRAETHLDATIAALNVTVHEVIYEDLAAAPRDVLMPLAERLRGDLSPDGQRRRVQRSLDCALIRKTEDAEQDEWRRRYREARDS